ncbi:hypothetical protein N9105_05225, partial [Akkermansiaceae bacterium]|nr:hypothetical protein [Akkermansiaceae bacterium]
MKTILCLALLTSAVFAEEKTTNLPVSKGLLLDLDANQGVDTEDGNRVKAWRNQIKGNAADLFVKQDKGRKKAGSGRPT